MSFRLLGAGELVITMGSQRHALYKAIYAADRPYTMFFKCVDNVVVNKIQSHV